MKYALTALIVSVLSMAAVSANAAETYTFDASHTSVVWTINHFGFSNPSGKFANIEGSLVLDEVEPKNSKVNATITIAGMVTGIAKLDEHLKSKDFFDAQQFPSATFASDKVEVTGKNTARVSGTLTLRGVAKPVMLDVTLNKLGQNMMQKKTAGFSATTTIKRSDFGMSAYVPNLGDEVKLVIESEANLQ